MSPPPLPVERSRRRIEPCTECRRRAPVLGETVCRSCQSVSDAMEQRRAAQLVFYANIDEVKDPHAQACLRALFHIARGEER